MTATRQHNIKTYRNMQQVITAKQRSDLVLVTARKGRGKWFYEGAGIGEKSLMRLRREGAADKEVVEKALAFLETDEAKAFIKAEREAKRVAA